MMAVAVTLFFIAIDATHAATSVAVSIASYRLAMINAKKAEQEND